MNRIASISSRGEIDRDTAPINMGADFSGALGATGEGEFADSAIQDAFLVAGTGAVPPINNRFLRLDIGGGESLTIFGEDDRIKVPVPSMFPWRIICHLEIKGSNGVNGTGTGWLAGKTAVVTAGHCVYHDEIGGWASEIRITPGLNGNDSDFGSSTSSRYECPANWVETGDPNMDFAVVKLDQPFDTHPGHYSFAALADQALQDQLVNICGYPYDKDDATTMWVHRDKIIMLNESRLHYHVDTEKGQSGAPVLLFPEGLEKDPVVVGIHSYGISGEARFNSAPRINPAVFDALKRWISRT